MSMKLPTAMTSQQHDDSCTSASCSTCSVSVGSLSIDTTQYDDNNNDDDNSLSTRWSCRDRSSRSRRASLWWPYAQVVLICFVTAVLAVSIMYLYVTHRLLFSSGNHKASTNQPTEKKQKSQMYWHKAIERRTRHLSSSNCKEATEQQKDSHGTLIPMNELELSTLLREELSSLPVSNNVRSSIETLRKLQPRHLSLSRINNSNNDNIRVRNASNSHDEDGSNVDHYYNLMTYESGTFYAIRSSSVSSENTFHADIDEFAAITTTEVGGETLEMINSCPFVFQFGHDNTGFEGMTLMRDLNHDLVMLVVCQGNHCSEDKKRRKERGNGVVLVMKKVEEEIMPINEDKFESSSSSSSCQWTAIRTLNVPSSAYFEGYSNIAISPQTGKIAVTSSSVNSKSTALQQENSRVWVGKLLGQNKDGQWDVDSMEFETNEFAVYDFPRDDDDDEDCRNIYSNVKGLDWIDDQTIVAVTDQAQGAGAAAKNSNDQPIRTTFQIPESKR